MKDKQKEKNQKEETIRQEPKPFKQWDIVKITGWLHQGKEWEIYDMFIILEQMSKHNFKEKVIFSVIIGWCFVEKIEQDFLSSIKNKWKKK